MHTIKSSRDVPHESGRSPAIESRLSRRTAMISAAVGAALAADASPAQAETNAASSYGAPIVELYVPAGVLSVEQKAEMIKRVTDVVLTALNLPADPARRMFVEVFETAERGFGVNGQVFVPSGR